MANDTNSTVPTVSAVAYNVGQKAYAIAVIALNAGVVIVFIAESLRTRRWNDLPKFNYNDVKSVVIASSLGGSAVGDDVLSRSSWIGDPSDRAAGATKVVLKSEQGAVLRLVPANSTGPN
jgi:hypothetical protein